MRMKKVEFIQADVFTNRPFTGNPLAIIPDGSGLTGEQMQAIAREMNLSETTFVLPPTDPKAQFQLRIFTPAAEVPLAGHPVVGTFFILAERGHIKLQEQPTRIFQQCKAGTLPVDIHHQEGRVEKVVMTQAEPQFLGESRDKKLIASAVGLAEDDVLPDDLPAQVVSTAMPQLIVPARGLKEMEKIELDLVTMKKIFRSLETDCFMIFARETVHSESDVHARMFAPFFGVPEDPATGSASGALGAYLVRHRLITEVAPTAHIVVEQGYEMGRPSTIHVEVDGEPGSPGEVRVGGQAVEVAEGVMKF
jgi:trans-2,3-dihydro-3-hydroxyanthranilate isomerase